MDTIDHYKNMRSFTSSFTFLINQFNYFMLLKKRNRVQLVLLIFTDKSELVVPVTPQLKVKAESDAPSCYHMSSLNENKAKQVCRRQPIGVIKYPLPTACTIFS